jgi:hypothetical protein
VAPPPRRRPVIRLALLALIGVGLYFGFEPVVRKIVPLLSHKASKLAPSGPTQSPLNQTGMELTWNADSSSMTVECAAFDSPACLQQLDSVRPGLAPWLGECLAKEVRVKPKNFSAWHADLKPVVDTGLNEPSLASLIRLIYGSGANRKVFTPQRGRNGLVLCLESGCRESEVSFFPVSPTKNVQTNLETQTLVIQGTVRFRAPLAGWVVSRNTVNGTVTLTVDHNRFRRSVFTGPLTLAADFKSGQYLEAGRALGETHAEAAVSTVKWFEKGQPILPPTWRETTAIEASADTTITVTTGSTQHAP